MWARIPRSMASAVRDRLICVWRRTTEMQSPFIRNAMKQSAGQPNFLQLGSFCISQQKNWGYTTGGLFVPVKLPQSEASAFEREFDRINAGRAQMDLYNRMLAAVPVRKPVTVSPI